MTYAPREIGCEGKVAFASPARARMAANRRPGRMSYRCRFCGAWHVGTERKRPFKLQHNRKRGEPR